MKILEKDEELYKAWLKVVDRLDDADEMLADYFHLGDRSKKERIGLTINCLKNDIDNFIEKYQRRNY